MATKQNYTNVKIHFTDTLEDLKITIQVQVILICVHRSASSTVTYLRVPVKSFKSFKHGGMYTYTYNFT